MANEAPEEAGWLVRVVMEPKTGRPITIMYAAAFADPVDAQEAVRYKRSREGEDVEAVQLLSWDTRKRLGLQPGQVWPL